jgi:hypothetical protein
MGELDDLAKQAIALAARVTRIESLTGTIVDRPMQHCAWRSKQGAGGDLFKSVTGRGPEVRTPVTALASAGGDLFKYRPDQARDERGRFTDEGGGRGRGRTRARKPKNEATIRAERRERYRQRGREQRAKERAARPKYREVPRLTIGEGASRSVQGIREAMTAIPRTHYDVLRTVWFTAASEMGGVTRALYPDLPEDSGLAGVFSPLLGIIVGETLNGIELDGSPQGWALHEMAHALDFYTRSDANERLSDELQPIAVAEFNKLSKAVKYYAETYDPDELPKELFAELYSCVYSSKHDREYLGVLTPKQVQRAFPKSIEKIKSFATREWTNA